MSLEGEFITSLGSFINGEPSNHYLQAIKPCKIWFIKKETWWLPYAQHAVLRDFWVRVLEAMVIGYEIRVYQHLAQNAEQRYHYFMKHFPQFVRHVPQKYLASMMGIKPESLSHIRAKLAKRIS
jgi:CRP-like cAMP-binding protein